MSVADDTERRSESATDDPELVELLTRVLTALGPYRMDLILIGGWVPYLYQRFGGFSDWRVEILRTVELDLFIPSPLKTPERPTLADILRQAGFEQTPQSAGAIWIREGRNGEMIEFFTSHTGTARQLGRPLRISGQAAISGISLQHLRLLTDRTKTLEIMTSGNQAIEVRVPTLGGYVLNKALTFMERLSAPTGGISKAAKDLVYIRDVMAGGESVRKQVRNDIVESIKSDKSQQSLLPTALDRLHRLGSTPSLVLEEAASQLAAHHGFPSEEAAKADLVGFLEAFGDLLDGIRRGRRAERGTGK